MASPTKTFPARGFFGQRCSSLTVGGFALAEHLATVPEREVERHTHSEGHLLFVPAGAYLTTARGAALEERGPLLVYNPPGTTHRDRFARAGGKFLAMSVDAAVWRQVTDQVRLPDGARLLAARWSVLATRLQIEARRSSPAAHLACESLALELLAAAAEPPGRAENSAPPWLSRACELLRDLGGAPTSISAIATEVGVHPVYLARAFRRHRGCTPGEYLRRCRLDRAAAAIATDSGSLAAVAADSGFSDQSHLTRSFQRAFGLSPGRFRDALRSAAGWR